jgi:ABC-type multidrug transport system fused ATPase/permease subunit
MRAVGASDRVFELLDKKPDMNIEGGKKLTTSQLHGKIDFNNVQIHITKITFLR